MVQGQRIRPETQNSLCSDPIHSFFPCMTYFEDFHDFVHRIVHHYENEEIRLADLKYQRLFLVVTRVP